MAIAIIAGVAAVTGAWSASETQKTSLAAADRAKNQAKRSGELLEEQKAAEAKQKANAEQRILAEQRIAQFGSERTPAAQSTITSPLGTSGSSTAGAKTVLGS